MARAAQRGEESAAAWSGRRAKLAQDSWFSEAEPSAVFFSPPAASLVSTPETGVFLNHCSLGILLWRFPKHLKTLASVPGGEHSGPQKRGHPPTGRGEAPLAAPDPRELSQHPNRASRGAGWTSQVLKVTQASIKGHTELIVIFGQRGRSEKKRHRCTKTTHELVREALGSKRVGECSERKENLGEILKGTAWKHFRP